jgi:exosortase/archaeosortase family protein|tara:strand:+ start:13219 stop:13740 length:522 start_codon:yes stop_codon:yes gene_type:complete
MKKGKRLFNLFLRYIILIIIAIPNLYLFYLILTPLTIYPSFFLLDLFFNVAIEGSMIFVQGKGVIEIIPACVAGAAYYLLLVLNLSIPDIKPKKRLTMILYAFSILLLANILRIFILTISTSSNLFNVAHHLFWYFFSTLFVAIIWFSEVKMFKIHEIPIYSDIKFLWSKIKR